MAAKTVLVYENINFLIIDNELKQVNQFFIKNPYTLLRSSLGTIKNLTLIGRGPFKRWPTLKLFLQIS